MTNAYMNCTATARGLSNGTALDDLWLSGVERSTITSSLVGRDVGVVAGDRDVVRTCENAAGIVCQCRV